MAQDSTRSGKRPREVPFISRDDGSSSNLIQGSAAMTTKASPPREVLAEKPGETSIAGSRSTNSGRCRLRKGMVILKNFLPASEQAELAAHVHHLGCLTEGGFYPCHNEKTKRMRMMNLGLRTDGGRHTLQIPRAWTEMAVRACREAAEIDASIPILSPDVCVVNHYTTASRLGWHQDLFSSRDPCLPVVSLSLGDTATFQYRLSWKKTAGVKSVMLESGDAFVFGGRSRGIIHAVPSITNAIISDKAAAISRNSSGSPSSSGISPGGEVPEPGKKMRHSSSCCVQGGGRFNLNFREL